MTATTTQDTAQTTCTACDKTMTPDSKGEWIACLNGKDVCINCCPCCDSGLFFEIGGDVYPAVAFGRPWNGFMTPTVTREVGEGVARMLTGEGLDDAMEFDGDTIVIRDLNGGEPDEYITPTTEATTPSGSSGGASAGTKDRPPTTRRRTDEPAHQRRWP